MDLKKNRWVASQLLNVLNRHSNFGHSSPVQLHTSVPPPYASLMMISPYALTCSMLNTPLVASTVSHSSLNFCCGVNPGFKRLTKTVVKCRRGYMWCARFVGSYTVEREALRRSLDGLELHLHIPDNTMSNTAKTSQSLAYSKKSREFRSSVTKSGSTPGGFPCMALPPGTEIAH